MEIAHGPEATMQEVYEGPKHALLHLNYCSVCV